jgi:hypothetical protein
MRKKQHQEETARKKGRNSKEKTKTLVHGNTIQIQINGTAAASAAGITEQQDDILIILFFWFFEEVRSKGSHQRIVRTEVVFRSSTLAM